jgi:pSer/pThr/pTyr-binding forkhead associated (FHA) protein
LRFRIRPPTTLRTAAIERTVDVDGDRPELNLGRQAGADIELPFNTVSARHARVRQEGSGWSVADVGSANGTFLDGQRLRVEEPRPLRPGQTVRLADVELIFEGPTVTLGPGGAPESTASLARRLVNDLFESCRPAEVARVVVVGGADADRGKELALAEVGRTYQVGRSSGCQLVLADDDVSREHAAFVRRWSGVEVRDLGSKNGIEVDGERVAGARRLRDGDMTVVGSTRLRLEDPQDRYLRQMQEEAGAPGATLVPADPEPAPPPKDHQRPPARRGGRAVAPIIIATIALAVLAAIGAVTLWLLVGE